MSQDRCKRCGDRGATVPYPLAAGLRLCEDCLPRFETAFASWLASTAGSVSGSSEDPYTSRKRV